MVTEMITLKLENQFLADIDSIIRKEGYQSRTEFIRNAIREKLEELKLKETIARIAHLRGAAKKSISGKEYEKNRQRAFDALFNKIK